MQAASVPGHVSEAGELQAQPPTSRYNKKFQTGREFAPRPAFDSEDETAGWRNIFATPQTPELLAEDYEVLAGGGNHPNWPGEAAVAAAFGDMTADDLQKAWGLWQAGEATTKAGEKAEETVEEDAMVQKDHRDGRRRKGGKSKPMFPSPSNPQLTRQVRRGGKGTKRPQHSSL